MNLARLRRRAAQGYWAEAVTHAVSPALGIMAAYFIMALFGFGTPWAFAGASLLTLLALGFGLSRLRRPDKAAIDRRIERASGLRHRPLAMLEDTPENDGPLTAAIWQIHQFRLAASLRNARSGRVFVDAVARDPLGLRALLLLLLLAGAIIAGPQAIPRIAGAFALPEWPFPGPAVNAWITPPAYAGAPPLVLQPGQTYPVLAGSSVTVIVDGPAHPPALILGAKPLAFGTLAQNSFRSDFVLTATAALRVGPWWHPLASWHFQVSPPSSPDITLAKPFIFNRQLVLNWQAKDRYGVESLTAALIPVGHPHAAPELFTLAITGPDPRNVSGVARPDIGDSPFAGLPVSLVLTARNLAGAARSTVPFTITLPPPTWHDKTALALAALRQNLALTPNKPAAGAALDSLARHPLSQITAAADVQMAALAAALNANQISAADAGSLLDGLAHQVELGPDYQPARALAAAALALEQALAQAAQSGKPIEPSRLQNLMAAMQAALAQHLQALRPEDVRPDGSNAMNPGDLNDLAEQIAADEAAGQTAKANAELHQLEQILSALQSAKPMSAAAAARNAVANQAAQDLAKMTQGESALLDQTNQGMAAPAAQAALQGQLASTRQKLGKAGIALPGLDAAAAAMGTAQNALGRQDVTSAMAAEGGAIEGLQKAAAALAASSQGFSFDASGQAGAATDSLENGTNGGPDENATRNLLPSAGDPAGAIQQQIIKNDSNPMLPESTHQYYHRLLNADAP